MRLDFSPERLEKARTCLESAIADGVFPGAVALVAHGDRVVAHWVLGHAQIVPEGTRRPMQPDTVFDLASLTKAVGGATAVLLLLEDGAWSLDDAVARFIPEFDAHGKGEITLRHLLSHSAGLPAWLPSYTTARDPEAALARIRELPLEYPPGTDVQYSDVGFSVLGHLVRRVAGEPIDHLLARRVWEPLGLHDTLYTPGPEWRGRTAATERGNRFEQEMLAARGESFDDWRTHVLVGEVHDGVTAYSLDGISSHAGLFSTAHDLLVFARMYLSGGSHGGIRILSPATVAEATSQQTAGLSKPRGLGWELLPKGRQPREEWAPSAPTMKIAPSHRYAFPVPRPYGDLLSSHTYGHTGFTGTSLAIDPERDLAVVLLTNRVHPDASNFGISALRPRFHNLVAASLVPA